MIIQGSNNSLVIQFDQSVTDIPTLVVTLWRDLIGRGSQKVKEWQKSDMTVDGDTVICEITEAETAALPAQQMVIEAKGLDGSGNTIFWDEYRVDVKNRRDKVIRLTEV